MNSKMFQPGFKPFKEILSFVAHIFLFYCRYIYFYYFVSFAIRTGSPQWDNYANYLEAVLPTRIWDTWRKPHDFQQSIDIHDDIHTNNKQLLNEVE